MDVFTNPRMTTNDRTNSKIIFVVMQFSRMAYHTQLRNMINYFYEDNIYGVCTSTYSDSPPAGATSGSVTAGAQT